MSGADLDFRVLANTVPQIIWSATAAGEIDFFNDQTLGYTGKSMDELRGPGWTSVIHPDDVENTMRVWTETVQSEEENQVEFRCRRSDGEYFWHLARAVPVRDESGSVVRWYGTATDIHDRKTTEVSRDSERRQLELVTDSLPILISYISFSHGEFRFRYVNAAYEKWFGHPRSKILGRKVRDVIGEEAFAKALPYKQQALGGVPVQHENEVRRADGESRWLSTTYVPDMANSNAVGLYVSITDITYTKAAEQALLSRNRQQQAVADLGQFAFIADMQSLFDRTVKIVAETLDVELCNVLELMPDGEKLLLRAGFGWREGLVDRGRVRIGLNSPAGYALRSSSPVIVDDFATEQRFTSSALLTAHGAKCGMACVVSGSEGRAWGVLGAYTRNQRIFTAEDVAFLQSVANLLGSAIQRSDAEAALQQANETLERRVVARTGQLEALAGRLRVLASQLTETEQRERRRLAALLHDHLQQLLVAARIHLQALTTNVADEELNASVLQGASLIEQAIEASRTLTTELRPPALYESGLAAGLVWLAGWMEEKHGLTVHVSADPTAQPPVENCGALLFESVRELLFNTVKHAGTHEAFVSLEHDSDGIICVIVRDQGSGFDPEEARPDDRAGGLGLFSIHERLQVLGGRMEIESAAGSGTVARLYAPLNPASAEDPWTGKSIGRQAKKSNGASDGHKRSAIRLLLADDHDVVRQGIVNLLSAADDIVVVAEVDDGDKAIAATDELRPDVVILDVNMPVKNGIKAAEVIRERVPAAQIIGLSVHVDQTTRQAMLDAGAQAYLPKDGPAEDLITAVRTLAASSRTRRSAPAAARWGRRGPLVPPVVPSQSERLGDGR